MHPFRNNNLLQTWIKYLNFFLLKSSPCQNFWPYVLWRNLETMSEKKLLLLNVFNRATFSSSEYLHYTAVVPELDSVPDISKVVFPDTTGWNMCVNTRNTNV